jgi:hypothetical protein
MFFITALMAMATALNTIGASVVIANDINLIKPDSVFGYYATSSFIGTFVTAVLGINMVQGVNYSLCRRLVTRNRNRNRQGASGSLASHRDGRQPVYRRCFHRYCLHGPSSIQEKNSLPLVTASELRLSHLSQFYVVAAVSQATYWNLL